MAYNASERTVVVLPSRGRIRGGWKEVGSVAKQCRRRWIWSSFVDLLSLQLTMIILLWSRASGLEIVVCESALVRGIGFWDFGIGIGISGPRSSCHRSVKRNIKIQNFSAFSRKWIIYINVYSKRILIEVSDKDIIFHYASMGIFSCL